VEGDCEVVAEDRIWIAEDGVFIREPDSFLPGGTVCFAQKAGAIFDCFPAYRSGGGEYPCRVELQFHAETVAPCKIPFAQEVQLRNAVIQLFPVRPLSGEQPVYFRLKIHSVPFFYTGKDTDIFFIMTSGVYRGGIAASEQINVMK
jgi:hypothetical protein